MLKLDFSGNFRFSDTINLLIFVPLLDCFLYLFFQFLGSSFTQYKSDNKELQIFSFSAEMSGSMDSSRSSSQGRDEVFRPTTQLVFSNNSSGMRSPDSGKSEKARRRTATTEELLFSDSTSKLTSLPPLQVRITFNHI